MDKCLEKWIKNYDLGEHMELLLEDEEVKLTAMDYNFNTIALVVQPEIRVWFEKGDIEGHIHLPLYPICPNMGLKFIDTVNDDYNLYGMIFTILGAGEGVVDADDWLSELNDAFCNAEAQCRELARLHKELSGEE